MTSTTSKLWLAATSALALAVVMSACGSSPASAGTSKAPSNLPRSALISQIRTSKVLLVGVATTPPFILQDPTTGKYVGPGGTLASTLAKKLGVRLEWVPETYNTIIAALQAHKIDLADAPLYATPQRLAVINMTPWASDGFCYLVKKSSSITSESQLNSSKVIMGNITGTGTLTATQGKYPKAQQYTRIALPGEQALIPELLSGTVDVDPVDGTLVKVYLSEYPQLRVVPADCSDTHDPNIPTPVAIGYNKGDSGFARFVKDTVQSIQHTLNSQLLHFEATKYMEAGVKP